MDARYCLNCRDRQAVAHFGVFYKMVHSLSEIWSAAATPPLWLSSQLTVGKEHPLLRPVQPKAKAPPLAAHSKWHRPISKMTHYQRHRRPQRCTEIEVWSTDFSLREA